MLSANPKLIEQYKSQQQKNNKYQTLKFNLYSPKPFLHSMSAKINTDGAT